MRSHFNLCNILEILLICLQLCSHIYCDLNANVRSSPNEISQELKYGDEISLAWNDWSEWTSCSKRCGQGIQQRSKTCRSKQLNPLPHSEQYNGICSNGAVDMQFRICELQSCKDGEQMQTEICSQYDQQLYNNRYYKWSAVKHDSSLDECKITCKPKLENASLSAVVIANAEDGMPCKRNKRTKGVCISGSCEHIGCDDIISSEKLYDMCAVCGGDNSSCEIIKDQFNVDVTKLGWHMIARIPRSAYNIIVTLNRDNALNRLVLSDSNGRIIIDGRLMSNGYDRERSAQFTYETESSQEMITSNEKEINQDIDVMLHSYGSKVPNINGSYQYSISLKNDLSTNDATTYGKNKSRNEDGIYDIAMSDSIIYPPPSPLPYCEWQIVKGTKTVQCFCNGKRAQSGNCPPTPIPHLPPLPTPTQPTPDCGTECKYKMGQWKIIGEWEKCSVECGVGIETLLVCCFIDNIQVLDINCDPATKPIDVRPCKVDVCWYFSAWNGWCVNGTESRSVTCLCSKDKCEQQEKPNDTRKCCVREDCSELHVFVSEWSKCSVSCGVGIETRMVKCLKVYKDKNMVQVVADSHCKGLDSIITTRPCSGIPCGCDWMVNRWCLDCYSHDKVRNVTCMCNNVVTNSQQCFALDKPEHSASSRYDDCVSTIWRQSQSRQSSIAINDEALEKNEKRLSTMLCTDKENNCKMLVGTDLCQYDYYRKVCCKTCRSLGIL